MNYALGMGVLEKRNSKINGEIVVSKSFGLGTYIQVQGLTQSGGIVERIWKQTLRKVHVSLKTNEKTLILGLGGATAAKVVKNFWPEAEITGVEIDPVMVELGKKYLNLNVEKIYIGDAGRWIQKIKANYDLVLVDTYLGDIFPEKFEEPAFLEAVLKIMNKKGVVVFNRLYYGDKRPKAVRFGEKLKKVFPRVEYFYPEANVMFLCRL